MGRLALRHSDMISFFSLTSISSGSAKMSIESKPISLVFRIPNAVPRPDWTQAELMRPSFMMHSPCRLLGRGGGRAERRAPLGIGLAGSRTVKQVPSPGLDCTSMEPRCSRTMP